MGTRSDLKQLVESSDIAVAPGVYDGITARTIEDMGFETAIVSGAGVSNSRLGKPDVGFLNLTENVDQCRRMADAVEIPLQADADTGYGNAINVYDTVKAFENAGVAAVMIEDQDSPKRCGHLDGKSVISREEMLGKVEAAVKARDETDPDLLIKARTDAAGTHGIDEAIRRLNDYLDLGADLALADALLSEEDIRRVCQEVDGPVAVNMGYGIQERPTTPLFSAAQLEDMGVALVSYPRLITGAAVKGIQNAFGALQDTLHEDRITTRPELTVTFEEYTDLFDLDEIDELEAEFSSVR
jgi:2-methylisocitrate lyase-like PEP mutase family enzyme